MASIAVADASPAIASLQPTSTAAESGVWVQAARIRTGAECLRLRLARSEVLQCGASDVDVLWWQVTMRIVPRTVSVTELRRGGGEADTRRRSCATFAGVAR